MSVFTSSGGVFAPYQLSNRLGQPVQVLLSLQAHQGRGYVFIAAPDQGATFIAKNAETFAFQVRERFGLDARLFDMVEVRLQDELVFLRWRFEWVGHSPLSPRCEAVSPGQALILAGLLEPVAAAAVVNA